MREGNLPLRTVLQNFTNHLDSLEADNEIKEDLHESEFQELKKFTEDLKGNKDYSTTEGERDCNRRKNRYKDVLPYDYTRVVLQDIPGVPGSDYVNANYIRGASGSRAYIASQGPLPHTVNEFWRMVVECDVQVIVMASNETEGGKHKCECYWVTSQGEEKQFGNVQVTYIKSRQVCPDFLVRTFKIKYVTEKKKKEERTICQFHYILWPDHGVPDTVKPLLDMVRLVRDCQASETLPVLVHCSAGCGRTGTICAIDYVWGLLRTGKLNHNLDLFGLVKEMRKQRVAMVQTREQYVLLHQAVKELFRERLKLIDAHPYENISTDGNPIIPAEKESDYEELYVSNEKQDESTKGNGGNCRNNIQATANSRGSIRRSASTSSLDRFNLLKPTQMSEKANHLIPTRSMYQPVANESGASNDSYSKTKNHASLLRNASDFMVNGFSERKRYPKPSKMEKDAENFAQLAKEKVMMSQQTRMSSNLTKKSIQDQYPTSLEDLPVSHRSRTPSPSMIYRQAIASSDLNTSTSKEPGSESQSKSSDLSNGANIQKLKEVFETTLSEARPVRLTRSASSVSIRPNFSVANSRDVNDVKKFSSKTISTNFKDKQLLICPPPPTDPIPEHWKMKRSLTALSFVTRKQSSEFHPALRSRYDILTQQDERPVLPIKKSKSFRWSRQDHNNLEGVRGLVRNPLSSGESSRSSKIDHDLNLEVPAVKERFKLSVYQGSSDVSSSSSSSASDIHNTSDNKPIVPPKKAIGERYKSLVTQMPSANSKSLFASVSDDKQSFGRSNHSKLDEKRNKASVGTQLYPNELQLKPKSRVEDVSSHGNEKFKSKKTSANSYVNAKLVQTTEDEDHYAYVPLPSKRIGRNHNPYVNYNMTGLSSATELSKTDSTQFGTKETCDRKHDRSDDFCSLRNSTKQSNNQPDDYEPVDFGETINISGENVFETVNYELVNPKLGHLPVGEQKDFYLNKDLDTIAKQVYKDCEAYLLSRDNSSPIPSLMPKQSPVESESTRNIGAQSQKANKRINPSELDHVINKIAVPPQGLRNRERRNSYRQAVNLANTGCGKPVENRRAKNIHKYERIWFENGEKRTHSKSKVFQESAPPRKQPAEFSLNINKDMNISNKDSLFKDKLEEIHLMMNDIERKHLQYLPDLSEEELSSKHSSSTSSLVSRSGQSSRSSERAEPVYVNTSSTSKAPIYLNPDEQKLAQFPGIRKTRAEHDSRALGGASHYGTLATTTSYPYRPNRAPQYGLSSGSGGASSIHQYTATLPLRSATISPENNVLYTPSIYRKPITQTGHRVKDLHHPLQVYQGSSKSGITAASIVKSPPVLQKKEHSSKKHDPLKKVDQPIKPSEVHRKRQQLNAKEPIFRPSDISLLPSHKPLHHSMSTPQFHTHPKKTIKSSGLESNINTQSDTARISSVLAESTMGPKNLKKKPSRDLNCVSSTTMSDSSPEDSSAGGEGVFIKFAPANILKKFRSAQASSSKLAGKEESPESLEYKSLGEAIAMSPPASPKTFTRAFDKFKTGSRNVAANFKSYIKGDRMAEEYSIHNSESCSTSNIHSYEDVKDYKYPLPLPKRPQGMRRIPPTFVTNTAPIEKKSKQQYL